MRNENNNMTRAAQAADPTNETHGWTRMPASTRNLLVKCDNDSSRLRGASAKSCVARTPCMVTTRDGRTYEMRRKSTVRRTESPATPVRARRQILRGDITTYLDVAARVGLNESNVATLYRYRRDNGYHVQKSRIVEIETNATFRGA